MRHLATLLGLLAIAAPAAAQPCAPARIEGCDEWLDRDALERALEVEGARCGAALACAEGRLTIGDDATAHDLRPMPSSVRARIVALLVAERMRARAATPRVDPETEPASVLDPNTDPTSVADPAPVPGPAPTAARASAPEPETEPGAAATTAPPRSATQTPPPSPDAPTPERRLAARLDTPALLRRAYPGAIYIGASDALHPDRSPLIGLGSQVRLFFDPFTAIAGPSGSLVVDALRIELGYGFGVASDAGLGSVNLSLGHASVGANVACTHEVEVALCVGALATIGYARADPVANGVTVGEAADGVYAGGAIDLGGWVSTEHVSIALGIRGGWGYGLVVRAEAREIAAIGGAWVGARLGLELGAFR